MSNLMDYFYLEVFERFTKKWVHSKPNIMEFNQFLDDIYGLDFAKSVPDLVNNLKARA